MAGVSLPPALQKLADEFSRLPGIGRKTATRLAFHIMNASENEAKELAQAILDVKEKIKLCRQCFNLSETELCEICSDPTRKNDVICVVEDAATILMLEKTNEYHGLYHVLGGVISPLDGVGPDDLNIKALLSRLSDVKEVILALNPSTEGEATSIYLSRILKPMQIKTTRLARGIPLGSPLEFVDELTLSKAIRARDEL
ncbi:MAG: recombination mediator RecR [Calditrichia bacterium]